MVKFTGDLSINDAELLEHYSRCSSDILEFGVGGSTQIFAQTAKKPGLSLDTDLRWVKTTQNKIDELGVSWNFKPLLEWEPSGSYDLVFVDGNDAYRRRFAHQSFPLLRVGGHMIFHDTRRAMDIANVTSVIGLHFNEIDAVYFNQWHSNMTVIRKKTNEPYVNWHKVEGKPEWMYGEINAKLL